MVSIQGLIYKGVWVYYKHKINSEYQFSNPKIRVEREETKLRIISGYPADARSSLVNCDEVFHQQVTRENGGVSAHRTPHSLQLQGWATQNSGNSEHHSLERKGGSDIEFNGSGRDE